MAPARRNAKGHFQEATMKLVRVLPFILLAFAIFPQAALAAGQLRAALLLEHDEDSPWNNMLREGLRKASQGLGIEARVLLAPAGPGQRRAFREAAEKSDIVLLASEGLHEVLRDEAGNFRRKRFGCIDTGIRAKNIMSISFADEEAAFLAGACAAMLAKSLRLPGRSLGWLSGGDGPVMRNLLNGFEEGARLENPGVRVHVASAGSYADGRAAAKAARQLLADGCGVIMLAAGAGNGAAKAALEGSGCLLMVMDRGGEALGEGYAGAIYKRADLAVGEILEAAASGKFRGSSLENRGLASGAIGFAGPPDCLAGPEIARRLDEIARELKNGGIRLRSLRARTLCDDSCFR